VTTPTISRPVWLPLVRRCTFGAHLLRIPRWNRMESRFTENLAEQAFRICGASIGSWTGARDRGDCWCNGSRTVMDAAP
jgi:hypothetical protein